MAERPSLGRDDSYNRVTVSRDLKSHIMSMIADSSESLPLAAVHENDDEDLPVKHAEQTPQDVQKVDQSHLAPPNGVDDMATPTPEKPNPLEQVDTVRVDSGKQGFAEPSPLRSHEVEGPELGKLGRKISRMVSHSQTDVTASADKEQATSAPLGATASRATTVSQTPSGISSQKGGARPGMEKRQSTMKRLSSAFKRTVSKNQ